MPEIALTLPAVLTARPQWVGWRFETRDHKPTKVPINPRTGRHAATDQPHTWSKFDDALAAVARFELAGVGFMFTEQDPLVGIDLDKCRDAASGIIEPWAQSLIDELHSYTEISPSGTGVHIILRGQLPAGGRRKGRVEMYDRGRYFTMTGDHFPGTPEEIQSRDAELLAVHAKVFGAVEAGTVAASAAVTIGAALSNEELIQRAMNAKNGSGDKFRRLWEGTWQSDYPSQSEADEALCFRLAFWTSKDRARMDALFRRSGLFRPKWDEKHYADGTTYGDRTIAQAVDRTSETYQGTRYRLPQENRPESNALTTFPLTDAGNAEHFAALYGGMVRYDHRRRRWLLWCTHRWRPDLDEEIRRLSKAASRERYKSVADCEDLNERERIAKWAIQSESRPKLDALLALAKAEKPIADSGEHWDEAPLLLSVPNGVIDLSTGRLRDGRQDDRLTMATGVDFQPDASCPRWERFIAEVFGGDNELVGFVRRAIGYSLTAQTVEQCLFLCYGTGANGKSTLVSTLNSVLGDYAWNMPFSTIEQQQRTSIPNDMAALVGRRFIIASETNDGTRLNEARVKALTGCDPITARFLHAEFFTFRPVAKIWLSCNHKPVVFDDSHGFWRRIRLIPFQQKFSINPTLGHELHAERVGILAWAVRACLEWRENGLQPPSMVTEATREYEEDSDPLAEFLTEFCVLDEEGQAGAAELYAHYVRWADYRGLSDRERLTNTMFGRKMGARFESEKMRKGRVYRGLNRRMAW